MCERDGLNLKFVCRDGCDGKSKVCNCVPICPHAKAKDFVYSVDCFEALCEYLDGRYSTLIDAARAHRISKHEFYSYRKICDFIHIDK